MKRDGRRGGVPGTLAGLLLGLVCLALLSGYLIEHNVRVRDNGAHGVRVESPLGNLTIRGRDRVDPEGLGIPVYPGARLEDRNNAGAVQVESDRADQGFSYVLASYVTDDSVDRVVEFYRNHPPHWIFTTRGDEDFHAEYSAGGFKRIVTIRREHGRTHIALASVGDAASN